MSDILLLNPPYTSLGYKAISSFASRSFPIGLGSISGTLRDRGFSFDIIDADALNIDIDEILRRIVKLKPRIIGISTYTACIGVTQKIAGSLKKVMEDSIIVLGGHHAFAARGELLNECPCDIVAIGEGEGLFADICDCILNKKDLNTVKGIYFRDNSGKARYTGERPYIQNLDELPRPAYELFPMDRYMGHFFRGWTSGCRTPFINMMTSRGCPFTCGFCSNVLWGKKVRFQSPERVISEIDYLVRSYGIKQLAFFDDSFTLDMKRAERICDLLIEKRYNLDISCATRADLLNDNLLEKMTRSGFRWIGIGIESGNERILKKISKGQSLKRYSDALKMIARHRIASYGSVIFGYPGEDKSTMRDTLSFMLANPVHLPQISIFVPYPGTPIYKELVEQGASIPGDINQFSRVVSYNTDISAWYLVFFQWYSYFRIFFRVRYFNLIRKTFILPIVIIDLARIALAGSRLGRARRRVKRVS